MKPLTKTFKTGTHLFHENDRSRELYIIQSGSVKVYRMLGNREVELAILSKGAVLGEMALIDGKPRSASAKALEDSCVILIDAETFHEKIRGVPPWFISVVRMTSQKIRQANQRLQTISSEHQGANIIITLLYCFNRFDRSRSGLDLHTTQTHLIQLLGVTHQKTMKVLDFLHKNGFIEIKDDKLTIHDQLKLSEYCEFVRLLIRKQFSNIPSLSTSTLQTLISLYDHDPDLFTTDEPLEINGTEFWNLLQKNNLTAVHTEIVDTLKDLDLLSCTRKEYPDKSQNPIAHFNYKINKGNWKRLCLFGKYNQIQPAV